MSQTLIDSHQAILSDLTDLQVLRRYGAYNDSEAFAEIVRRHAAFVFSTCLRVLGDAARAQDVSQETFFRLMQRPHEINQSLGAWLHRTATHLSVDSLRSESARRRREINYDATRNREASTWSELSPAVDQAMSELPEELRVIMVQHFLMGKSQAQLAQDTGQSPATICRRVHEGLDELRQHLRLKGIYALPTALAGLLCHASARQAPAALVQELGKMAMFSGASSAAKIANASGLTRAAFSWTPIKIVFMILTMSASVYLLRLATTRWLETPLPVLQREDNLPHHPAIDPEKSPNKTTKVAKTSNNAASQLALHGANNLRSKNVNQPNETTTKNQGPTV